MTVRIEIQADSGTEAAAELKRLADGLAIMGLMQQRALASSHGIAAGPVVGGRPIVVEKAASVGKSELGASIDKTASEAVAEAVKKAATAEQPAAEKAEPKAEATADKPKRGRKSKAAKEAEAQAAADTPPAPVEPEPSKGDETPAENPNPYRLFDENGAEEELFDTADAYKTALINMLKDAPDEMTCTSVGKANEDTVKRLQEEGVDFKDIVDAYQGRLSELKAKKTEDAPTPETIAPIPADEPTKVERRSSVTLDAVKAAIVSLSSAKGVPVAIATLKQFGASKAGEVKEGERAAFVKACEEAAA